MNIFGIFMSRRTSRKWARVMQDGLMQLVVLGIMRNVLKSCEHFLWDKFLEESQRNGDEMLHQHLLQAKAGEGKKAQRVCAKPGNKPQRSCWVHAVGRGKGKAHKSLFSPWVQCLVGAFSGTPCRLWMLLPARFLLGFHSEKCHFSSSQEPYNSHWNGILFNPFNIKFIPYNMGNLSSFLLKTHMLFSCRGRLDFSSCLPNSKYFLVCFYITVCVILH